MNSFGLRRIPAALPRAIVAALALAACTGCGARSDLSTPPGPPTPVSELPCGQASPGTEVWQVTLPSDQSYTGPWAADGAGTTYYLGTDSKQSPTAYTIAALDSCGRLRWRSAARPPGFLNGAVPDLLVDGDRVLFQWGTVDAFDRETGAHLWNVDLDAYTGEKLAFDDSVEIGPMAVSSDGTAFLAMWYADHPVILSIDPTGAPQTMADASGASGDITGFLLDADDHLDILFNSTQGSIVTSYARDGAKVFSSAFTCLVGSVGPLAAGSGTVVMQSGPCVMDLTGTSTYSPPEDSSADSVTIDAANNLYVAGGTTGLTLTSLDATGAPRWSAPGTDYVVSSPLLATGGQVFNATLPATIPSMAGPVTIVVHDTATGTELARYPTNAMLPGGLVPTLPTLVTPAGQVVFGVGGTATAIAVGQTPDRTAAWPTGSGGVDRRNAALGR